ncbi:hypothetical protein CY652_07565 [Burkholderia sp. WAC0059]|nr:hypothetical protein CY652_07565 [Burkholderia sp. WAC0059]
MERALTAAGEPPAVLRVVPPVASSIDRGGRRGNIVAGASGTASTGAAEPVRLDFWDEAR